MLHSPSTPYPSLGRKATLSHTPSPSLEDSRQGLHPDHSPSASSAEVRLEERGGGKQAVKEEGVDGGGGEGGQRAPLTTPNYAFSPGASVLGGGT